jgi:hypothetical protein
MTRPKRRTRGRPELPAEDLRTSILGIRLSRDERSRIEETAYESGARSASDWARSVLLAATKD